MRARDDLDPSTAPSGRLRPVGVEEELLLVDAHSMLPVPVADDVVHAAREQACAGLELEVKREQIEVVSPPLYSFGELSEAIVRGRRCADDAAATVGARAVALGTAAVSFDPHAVAAPRNERMLERFGLLMQEQLTCGFHVHVGIDSPAEGVGVLDRIRPWLPALLALSANSPYWRGLDTGFASYRYQLWGRWPTAGSYDIFGSHGEYRRAVDELLGAEVPLDDGMVYFDARLSHHVPTVEVRIADVCLDPHDAAALASVVRALVNIAAIEWRADRPPAPIPTRVLRLASWRASRFGITEHLLHPVTGTPTDAAAVVEAVLEHADGGFTSSAERDSVRGSIGRILGRGNGAVAQRRALSRRMDFGDTVADALDRTRGTNASP